MGIIRAAVAMDRALERKQQAGQSAGGSGGQDGGDVAGMGQPEPMITIPLNAKCPLDEAREFAAKILWAPDYMLDALTLIAAASHTLDSWNTVPRVLASAPTGLAGKTTLLNTLRLLAQNTWSATGATSYALKSKFTDREPPFPVVEEAQDFFGTSGRNGAGNPIGLVARDCYQRTATVSISNNRTSEDIPAFCFMAMGGRRNAVPADIYSRCIDFKMRRVPESVTLEFDSLDPDTEAEAVMVRAVLHSYMRSMLAPEIKKLQRRYTSPHPKFRDRLKQIWGPVYLTARAADAVEAQRYELACQLAEETGTEMPEPPALDWAQRALTAFKAMALDASDLPALMPAQAMLRDAASYIRNLTPSPEFVAAADLRDWLRDNTDEQLWSSLTDRRLAILMVEGLGPNTVRARADDPTHKARGWGTREVLARWDALERALTPPAAAEPDEDESSLFDDLDTEATEVAEVLPGHAPDLRVNGNGGNTSESSH